MEEHKLAEAYLKKAEEDCQYCAQSDGVDPDHCQYCHDSEAPSEEETCPYCKGSQNDTAEGDKMPEVAEQDCAYCNEMDEQGKADCQYCNGDQADQSPSQANADGIAPNAMNPSPDSHNDFALAGSDKEKEQYDRMGMNPPMIGKPIPSEQAPIGQNPPMDVVPKGTDPSVVNPGSTSAPVTGDPELEDRRNPGSNSALPRQAAEIDPEDNHSKAALQSIAEEIKSQGTPTSSEVDSIDDADMASGTDMEGNISRPEDFAQNTPSDMGEQGPNAPVENNSDPDLFGVLEEGLNSNADSIQREKVVRIVSQALTQFKGCKQSLEAIKMQNPQLYQASITMLKAMIEMANLLGLGQNSELGQQSGQSSELGQAQEALMPEAPAPQQDAHDWHEPFSPHPDHGGEAKPGHAPSKNNPEKKEGSTPPPQH